MNQRMKYVVAVVVMCVATMAVPGVRAQQSGPPAEVTEAPQPLKVKVTISRFEDGEQTAQLPFELWVNTEGSAQVRLSTDVPIPSARSGTGASAGTSYTYRSIGTNIDCFAVALGDGLYRLGLTVEDSQVFRGSSSGVNSTPSVPSFQTFRSTNQPILRDGQSVQYAVATDKSTGELIMLEVALEVLN